MLERPAEAGEELDAGWLAAATDVQALPGADRSMALGLTHRTLAWIVAITFVGLLSYLVGRVITSRRVDQPPG